MRRRIGSEKLRLIATIIDCDYDDLYERERRRAQTRRTIAIAASFLLVLGAFLAWAFMHSQAFLEALRASETTQVPKLVEQLDRFRPLVQKRLVAMADEKTSSERERLHAHLALAAGNSERSRFLFDQLYTCQAFAFPVISDSLVPHAVLFEDSLWQTFESAGGEPSARLRAAACLAVFPAKANSRERIIQQCNDMALQLVHVISRRPNEYDLWSNALNLFSQTLIGPLAAIKKNAAHTQIERAAGARLLTT